MSGKFCVSCRKTLISNFTVVLCCCCGEYLEVCTFCATYFDNTPGLQRVMDVTLVGDDSDNTSPVAYIPTINGLRSPVGMTDKFRSIQSV